VHSKTKMDAGIYDGTISRSCGRGLKLLVLLHSMVEGEEAQLDVMHVLLPVIIAAASVNVRDNQVNLHVYCVDPSLDRK
jgi:anaerobic C4-dicarboxylate transporter